MVNMYSGSMMPIGGMNTNMNGFQGGGTNAHQALKAKYGVGYEDFGSRPYAQPYPMAIVPRRPEPACQKTWLGRFIQRCFLT